MIKKSIKSLLLIAALMAAGFSCPAVSVTVDEPLELQRMKLPGTLGDISYLDVVLGQRSHCERLPVIVAIHGWNSFPAEFLELLPDIQSPVRVIVPSAPIDRENIMSWYPWPDVLYVKHHTHFQAQRIASLLEELLGPPQPANRVVVAGYSQGGAMSYVLASQHTEWVHSVVSVSAASIEKPLLAEGLNHVPTIDILHARGDKSVTFARGVETAARFSERGWPIKVWPFDWNHHELNDDMLERWSVLLEQRIAQAPRQSC